MIMGFGMNMEQRRAHVEAQIRSRLRDAEIEELLSMSEDVRARGRAVRVREVAENHEAVGQAISKLASASDDVRAALEAVHSAAVASQGQMRGAAEDALVLLEIAAQDARAILERETTTLPGDAPTEPGGDDARVSD